MCFICGRGNCCPAFHSPEEQAAFQPASEAYERFLEIREQCAIECHALTSEEETED